MKACVAELKEGLADLESHSGVQFDTATYVAELMTKRGGE